jgi:hypothetical protein
MGELLSVTPSGLAYRTYRIWGDFWKAQDPVSKRTPPLYHSGRTINGGALIIAPCSLDEVAVFIASSQNDSSVKYKIEASELGTEWIGFWCLFSVSIKEND